MTTGQNQQLQPCPFCGHHGLSDPRHTIGFPGTERSELVVTCGMCGAKGPWVRYRERPGLPDLYRCEGLALSAWNRRTAAPTPVEQLMCATGRHPDSECPGPFEPGCRCMPDGLVLRITTAYEQGFGHATRSELSNPYATGTVESQAWAHGREVGKRKAAGQPKHYECSHPTCRCEDGCDADRANERPFPTILHNGQRHELWLVTRDEQGTLKPYGATGPAELPSAWAAEYRAHLGANKKD